MDIDHYAYWWSLAWIALMSTNVVMLGLASTHHLWGWPAVHQGIRLGPWLIALSAEISVLVVTMIGGALGWIAIH